MSKVPQITSLYEDKVFVVDVDHGDNFDAGYMEALYFEAGCYYQMVVNSNGINLTPIIAYCNVLNTSEIDKIEEFTIKPNLFIDELTIQYPSSIGGGKVFIYNIFGDLIENFTLQSGQYEMTFSTNN